MSDYYAAVIRERGDSLAAQYLADDCRKKDDTIARLERELEEARKLDNADIEAFHDVYAKNTVLEAENAALKAEVERVKADFTGPVPNAQHYQAEIKALRARAEQAEGKVEKAEELMERRFCENGPYDYIGLLLKQILK